MRYVRIQTNHGPSWGVLEGKTVRLLAAPPYESLTYTGETRPLEKCQLLAPAEPTKIICVGKNYAEHAREMGAEPPGFPVLFLKGPNTVNHPFGNLQAPSFVQRFDYEGELGVVVGRRAKNVKAKDFANYVLGYTCLVDATARDVQQHDGQWTRGKSMDGFCPMGPWLETDLDPGHQQLTTRLNSTVVQSGNTADFVTPVPQLIEFITASMTLEPGDVIATGTPSGVGPMRPGDALEVEIESIGTLCCNVL